MRKYLLAALVAGTVAAPALAQEDVRAPFTGPRVGVIVGYDNSQPGSSEDSDIDGDDQSVEGLLYGFDIGYDVNVGSAVIGAEAELTDSTGKVDVESTDPDAFGFGRVAADRDIYVGLRAGFLATPETLIYAKGGYTNAKYNILASDGETELDSDFKLDGYRVGAGVERTFGNNTYGKIEYRYSNYSEASFEFPDGDSTDEIGIDTDRHQVAVGLGIRF
jgi:outer membrane immunogenic protein